MIIESVNIERTILQHEVAIVTGAGQGIGRDIARGLAFLGASVVIAEINDSGQQVEQQIRSEGGRVLFIRTDVSDVNSMENLRQQVAANFGTVTILVNNAAAYTTKALLEHTVEEWDRVLAVNLRGAFLGIKTFLPDMLRQHKGVVVTMESADGMPYLAPYLASKAGIRSMTMSLAQEIGNQAGVSIYGFGPGMVETPGAMEAFRRLAPQYGLSLEQFIKESGGQAISSDLCATGLVGTILHAEEFHGDETAYMVGLSKLGLTASGQAVDAEPSGAASKVLHSRQVSPDILTMVSEAIALNAEVEKTLRTIIKEFEELTMFQRPFVKRMFRQGTGEKAEDLLANVQMMARALEELADDNKNGTRYRKQTNFETYIAQVRRLAAYFTKQQSDARGWFKDPEKLNQALAALQERNKTATQLAGVLDSIQRYIQ